MRNATNKSASRLQNPSNFLNGGLCVRHVLEDIDHQYLVGVIIHPRPGKLAKVNLQITAKNVDIDVSITPVIATA